MKRSSVLLTIVLVGLFVVLGCSGGGGNPVAPDTGPEMTLQNPTHGGQFAQTQLWGYWDVYMDLENMTVEAIPNRALMFTANVTGLMNNIPGTLAFSFNGVTPGPDYNDVDLDLSMTHPVPGKPNLNGYDVRGIFMGNGSSPMDYNSDVIYPVPGTDQMMMPDPDDGFGGPDGYTRWFNAPEFSEGGMPLLQYIQGAYASRNFTPNATLCPYKYYADGLGTNDDVWDFLTTTMDNGVFSSGATNTRNYYLRFPNATGIKYGYAVIANWEGGQPQHHPSNTPETVGCDVADSSTVYYVDPGDNGGDIILDLSFFGWEGQPSAVWLESTVLSAPYEFDPTDLTPIGGTTTYSTYHVEVPADDVQMLEGNEFWVVTEAGAYDYTNDFGVPNLADTDILAAFFRFDLEVSGEPGCPTPDVLNVFPIAGNPDTNITATISVTQLQDGASLAATLVMDPDMITGTSVTYVDPNTLTAEFDLTGATLGMYDVLVTNGCGGIPGVGVELFEVTDCVAPDPVDFPLECVLTDEILDDVSIACDLLEDGSCLDARLIADGLPDIVGTDIQYVAINELTADFDLTGVPPGLYSCAVTNGCCSPPAIEVDAVNIAVDPGPLSIHGEGPVPDPLPVPDDIQFCVVGDDSAGFQGVYYFGEGYDIMYYPIDYSGPGEIYFTMEGNYSIDEADFFGPVADRGAIEVDASGGVTMTMHGDGYIWSTNSQNMCSVWFASANPEVQNASTLLSTYGLIRSRDCEGGIYPDSVLWTLFGTESVIDPSVEVVLNGVGEPYEAGNNDISEGGGWSVGWAPLDQSGSVDGEVSDLETYKLGIDDDPQGLTGSYDLIFYYLEGDPDDAGIEVFQATRANGGTDRLLITTIDTGDFVGTPVDISVVNSAGNLGCEELNWVCVLEDNGDDTYQIAVFNQDGDLIERLASPVAGTPLGLDCDTATQEIHVWADDFGTLEFTIFGWR